MQSTIFVYMVFSMQSKLIGFFSLVNDIHKNMNLHKYRRSINYQRRSERYMKLFVDSIWDVRKETI